eukprot:COSAG06_NODE_14520_length_1150_cov_0.805899_2_plen_105_part_01
MVVTVVVTEDMGAALVVAERRSSGYVLDEAVIPRGFRSLVSDLFTQDPGQAYRSMDLMKLIYRNTRSHCLALRDDDMAAGLAARGGVCCRSAAAEGGRSTAAGSG